MSTNGYIYTFIAILVACITLAIGGHHDMIRWQDQQNIERLSKLFQEPMEYLAIDYEPDGDVNVSCTKETSSASCKAAFVSEKTKQLVTITANCSNKTCRKTDAVH